MIRENFLETGKIIKWMEKEFLLGLIVENIQVNIKKIKNTDMGFLNGKKIQSIFISLGTMEENIKENGN
jgi:hypothetical protein